MPPEDNKETIESRIASLEAYIASFTSGPDAALAKLEGNKSPEALRRRLLVLINAKKTTEAAQLAKSTPPNADWCEVGVRALALNGDLTESKGLIAWASALPDLSIKSRCIVNYGSTIFRKVIENRTDDAPLAPGTLNPSEIASLEDVVQVIEPIYASINAKKRVENELESESIQILFNCLYLLGQRTKAAEAVRLLLTRTPIPLVVGQATFQGLLEPADDLPIRIRKEHPDSFGALLISVSIEAHSLNQSATAFRYAIEHKDMARNKNEKRQLCELLYELATELGAAALAEFEQVSASLVPQDDEILKIFAIENLLKDGKYADAIAQLESSRDESNPHWLRLFGQGHAGLRNYELAFEYFSKASLKIPHPALYKAIASAAHKLNRLSDSAKALERAVALVPSDVRSRADLADLYAKQGDLEKAATHLQILHEEDPSNELYTVNLAVCLASLGRAETGLQVLNEVCDRGTPPMTVLIATSQLYQMLGDPKNSLAVLNAHRSLYWDKPAYLQAYMTAGYAAQEESSAHEAFVELHRMYEKGEITDDVMHRASLDEVVDVLKKSSEQMDLIHKNMLEGKFPWTLAAEIGRNVPYWDWYLRTQPLTWFGDAPLERAKLCIYASNGFRVLTPEPNQSRLEEIQCPPPGSDIVVDISALITLHRLNKLDALGSYFGKVHIPAAYLSYTIEETQRLFPHQKSQETSLKAIKAEIDSGKIVARDKSSIEYTDLPAVDEYSDETKEAEHVYRIQDLLDPLHHEGHINDTLYAAIKAVAHKPSGVDDTHLPLSVAQAVQIDLQTLKTLCNVGALEVLTRTFSLVLSREEHEEILSGLRAFGALEQVRSWYTDLWDKVRGDKSILKSAFPMPRNTRFDDLKGERVSLAAYHLAEQLGLPLLADDRVCQALVLNNRPSDKYAAFSSNHLIMALSDSERITPDAAANAIVDLMRWRYRFVLPSTEILLTLTSRFITHPPGADLRLVARYVHSCMSDPGLFGGFEPTHPPTPIAVRLFQTWARIVAEWIMAIWSDSRFDDQKAQDITTWGILELLPSPPSVLSGVLQARLADLAAKTVISHALIQSSTAGDSKRVNRGLTAIAHSFGLNEESYLKIVAEVIDDTTN